MTQKLTTSYHPQTNFTERINKTLKTIITSFVKENHRHWDRWISEFCFAINFAWQESTALQLRLHSDVSSRVLWSIWHNNLPTRTKKLIMSLNAHKLSWKELEKNVVQAQTCQEKYYNRRRKHEFFQQGI